MQDGNFLVQNLGFLEFLNETENQQYQDHSWKAIEYHVGFDLLNPESVFRTLRDSPSLNIDLHESNSFYKS